MLKQLLVIVAGAAVLLALASSSADGRSLPAIRRQRRPLTTYGANPRVRRTSAPSYPAGFRSLHNWEPGTRH